MNDDFPDAMVFVLRWEGGLVDDPADHGGRTMKGVTQRVYDAWRTSNGQSPQDVAQISSVELNTIYKNEYWLRAFCDRLRPRLDLVEFDTAVMMGQRRAVLILQAAVGAGADGQFGPNTQTACDNCSVPDAVTQYCARRESLIRGFAQQPNQARFLRGWLNRLNSLRVAAGVPGFAATRGEDDFGDTGRIERIPDLAPGQPLEEFGI